MTKWEYRVESISSVLGRRGGGVADRLNSLGEEGWEAVSASYTLIGGKYLVLLKRPLS